MAEHDTDRPFALVQLSDPHLYADPQTRYRGWNTDQALDQVLEALRSDSEPIDALLLTGDLAQDEAAATYTRLSDKLSAFGKPVFALPGNHDDPQAMQTHLQAQLLGEVELGAWQLLLLSSHQAGRINGYLSDAELNRAAAFVEQLNGPGLIAVHHQPLPIGSSWIDSLGLDNGHKLADIARQQPRLKGIVFGHVHQAVDTTRQGLRLLGCPSTWRQFPPGARKAAEAPQTPPGYRRLYLHGDGRLETEILRVADAFNSKSAE